MEEEQDFRELNPAWLFLVTGFSFLLVTLLLSIVDGEKIILFLWIGTISFAIGLLTGAVILVKAGWQKKERASGLRE